MRAIVLPTWGSARRRCWASAVMVAAAMALFAAPALATPQWEVTTEQHNLYGLQGVPDPNTGSSETFARESGDNTYAITVKNNGSGIAGEAVNASETLRCLGTSTVKSGGGAATSLAYQWLRDGQPIAGATEDKYPLGSKPENEGAVIQCEVIAASNALTTVAVSRGVNVAPVPAPLPPAGGTVTIAPQGDVSSEEETKLKCSSAGWKSGTTPIAPKLEYQWLREGKAIEGATEKEYTLTAKDEDKAVQCEVTAAEGSSKAKAVAVSSGEHAAVSTPPSKELELEGELPIPSSTIATARVDDTLPEGMELAGPGVVESGVNGWACEGLAGTRIVECANTATLEGGKSYKPILLTVYVGPKAADEPTNELTVSGGGATGSEAKPKTKVTPAVPFGIKSFETSVAKSLAEPLTEAFEAGSHPYSITTKILLNYTTNKEGALIPAGGGTKAIEVEAPPGFAGPVQNTPRCSIKTLQANACPVDTAVGYTEAILGGHLEGGKANFLPAPTLTSLVFNVEPTPGYPAEFGFVIHPSNDFAFILPARVESNGDFGITVGDDATANGPKVMGSNVTLCENGAAVTKGGVYSCNSPAGSRPFLDEPTGCTGPLPWTAYAAPWDEPEDYQSAARQTKALSDCGALHFQPGTEAAFYPSPPEKRTEEGPEEGGTTQPDKPTAMTLELKVPQAKEEPEGKVAPEIRDVKTTLPAGMTVSPSAASGLEACSNAEFGFESEFGPGVEARKKQQESETGRFVPEAPARLASCKPGSQIGTVEVFAPLLSGAPAIEGERNQPNGARPPRINPAVARQLKCLPGQWSDKSASLSYQWLRNGTPIPGASGTVFPGDYTVNSKLEVEKVTDEGAAIQCEVTATNSAGSSVAVSRDVVPFEGKPNGPLPSGEIPYEAPPSPPPSPPSSIAKPSAQEGKLTCTAGQWLNASALEYQWLRGGVKIEGQTGETYTLSPEDNGKVIQCRIIATNAGGKTIADSAGTIISPQPPTPPPLPGGALQGQMFVGEPECGNANFPTPCTEEDAEDGKLFRLFLQFHAPLQDSSGGVIIKLHGYNEVCTAKGVSEGHCTNVGQIKSVFDQQPQLPFELLKLKLKGGPRAPLANPQMCGPAETKFDLTPWGTPETEDANLSSQFEVEGEGCPATLPFGPHYFNAGTSGPTATSAGAYTSFSLTIGRSDGEQDLSGVTVHMPLGLTGKIAGIPRCEEAEVQAAERGTGGCPADSEIGTATSFAGPGEEPFKNIGHVYFTGPVKSAPGAPFGIVVITAAEAGPFHLGNVVVRSRIDIDPHTAAVTATSQPLPQFVDGVQLRLKRIEVDITKAGFMLNPTNCSAQTVSATLTGSQGASVQATSPFGIGGCTSLPFAPKFTASTQAHTSKQDGASLNVKITYPAGAYANIAKTLTELPVQLPSRLTTLQKACLNAVFEANPAACPEGSVVGTATAHTPLLNVPLSGPAYLVSHGGAAFPDLEIVLQGEGVEVILDGQTDIKKGITKTTFNAVPDSPVETFEVNLPEGPHSALSANVEPCSKALTLPTVLTAQNGAVIKQTTPITVIGCPPTVTVTKTKVSGNALLVTVKMSAKGTVKIAGNGLKTTKKTLAAGTHQIRVPFTKAGRLLRKHSKKVRVGVSLTVGRQVVSTARAVRL